MRLYKAHEVTRVMLNLPDTQDSPHSSTAGWLSFSRDITTVHSLVGKEDDTREHATSKAKGHPVGGPPIAGPCNNEISKKRAEVRRREEEGRPDPDFSSLLVKEEYILDESETDGLGRGQCDTHQGAQTIVSREIPDQATAQSEQGARERGPEEHWRSTPDGNEGKPKQSSYSSILSLSKETPVDFVQEWMDVLGLTP